MLSLAKDFVDRDKELADLTGANPPSSLRLLLVTGEEGMGKTSLLAEYADNLRQAGLEVAAIDLHGRDFMSVLNLLTSELDSLDFSDLHKALNDLPAMLQRGLPAPEPPVGVPTPAAVPAQEDPLSQTAAGSGFDFTGPATFNQSQLALGSIFNNPNYTTVYNLYLSEDPAVKNLIISFQTRALRASLARSGKPLVIIFDNWDAADPLVQRWLRDNLLDWALNNKIPSLLLACSAQVGQSDLENLRGELTVKVGELPQQAVYEYWVIKKRLPAEALSLVEALVHRTSVLVNLAQDAEVKRSQQAQVS